MISHLEDRFGLGETNDTLLLEFHQMSQGVNEKVQDYGSKLECKLKILQERFPVYREKVMPSEKGGGSSFNVTKLPPSLEP